MFDLLLDLILNLFYLATKRASGLQGRIQDFHFIIVGAQKIMCSHTHYERKTELTFGRGPGPA